MRERHSRTCAQCGKEWIDQETARKIESIVADARAKRRQVEVTDLAA